MKPKVIVLSGYGINGDEEMKYGFELAGADAEIVHINDVIEGSKKLSDYQIMAIGSGFAFGDHTGGGKAYANKIKNHLWEEVQTFVEADKLVLGICNGFQIITTLGLLPGALTFNTSARYVDRWIDMEVVGESPWLTNIKNLPSPTAHGEGRFYAPAKTLKALRKNRQIALRYIKGEMHEFYGLPANPNGSLDDIAGVLDESGKMLGLMPHFDRAIFFTQLPHWTYLKEKYQRGGRKLPEYGPGLVVFKNGVEYFR